MHRLIAALTVGALIAAGAASMAGTDLPLDLTVEIDFTNDPLDVSTTWVDVTDDVVSAVSYSFGVQRSVGRAQPGRGRYTLLNTDREYDPLNTSGSHYGDLLPRRRTRIRQSSTVLAYGYIDGWSSTRTGPEGSFVDITFTDAFTFLARHNVPPVWEWTVADQSTDLLCWLRFNEPSGQIYAFDESGNDAHAAWIYDFGFWVGHSTYQREPATRYLAGGHEFDFKAVTQAAVDSVTTASLELHPSATITDTSFTVAMWLGGTLREDTAFPGTFAPATLWYQETGYAAGTGASTIMWLYVDPDGVLSFSWSHRPAGGSYTSDTETATGYRIGYVDEPHHVAVGRAGSAVKIWLDGVDIMTAVMSLNFTPAAREGTLPKISPTPGAFRFSEVMVWDRTLSNSDIAALYAAGAAPAAAGSTAETLDEVIGTIAAVPIGNSYETGGETGPVLSEGRPALTVAQEIVDGVGGLLFVDRDGILTYFGDDHWDTADRATRPRVRFTDDILDAFGVGYVELDLPVDETDIANDVTVEWQGGKVQVEDAASIASYGRLSMTVATQLGTEAAALRRAQSILAARKDPTYRPTVTVAPIGATELAKVLTIEVGDMVHVIQHHTVGSTLSSLHHVESIDLSVGPGAGDWVMRFGLTGPAYVDSDEDRTWIYWDSATTFDDGYYFYH